MSINNYYNYEILYLCKRKYKKELKKLSYIKLSWALHKLPISIWR